MKQHYKRRYGLSEQGAQNLVRSTWACFFSYLINLLPMFLLMALADQLMLGHVRSPWLYLGFAILSLILLYFLLSHEYVSMYNTTYKESAQLRINIAETLAELPLAYFSKHDLSDLSQTIMADVERLEHAMSHAIPKVSAMYVFFPILAVLMIIGNWKLGLAAILPTLFSFFLIPLSRKRVLRGNKKYYDVLRANSESFQESIELQKEIRSYNLSKGLKAELYQQMDSSERIHVKVEAASVVIMGLSSIFSFVSAAVVIVVGVLLLLQSEITVLYLLGYLIAALKIKELVDISKEGIMEVFYIEPALERIREIRQTPRQEGRDAELRNFDITFDHVSFAYDPDTPVLRDVSFTARQGEVTALVGASGSGKTSVLRLVSRLYDYDGGNIQIGGRDIKGISAESLFTYVSIVFQDVTLFNASVMENIRLGNPAATDEEVRRAAKLANCMDFIERLPDGFDSVIGENGAELSGGERQRLSIARAFLKDAPILILDEIAASLDVDHERKIQESLNSLIQNKTVIIISHRLKSIENVDQIVVLDDGCVETAGAHHELLGTSRVYRNLVEKTKQAEAFSY